MSFQLCPDASKTYDYQSLTTPYKYLYLIRPHDINIRIYQPHLVSSDNAPQEVSIDAIKNVKNNNVNLGGVSNEPVLNREKIGEVLF